MAQAGYGKTRKEVRSVAGMVAVDKGRRSKPIVSEGWFRKGNHICHTEGEILQQTSE